MKILFVGCTNLGCAGADIVQKLFADVADVTVLCWGRGDTVGRKAAKTTILSQKWDLLLSFYNDLVFSPEELAQCDLAVNLHPSKPELRGRGYDTLPIIERHTTHSTTLHFVENAVDSGPVIEVFEWDLSPDADYTYLRQRNQELCLHGLQETCGWILAAGSVEASRQRFLEASRRVNRRWGSDYITAKRLKQILQELYESEPDHRVFQGMPDDVRSDGAYTYVPSEATAGASAA